MTSKFTTGSGTGTGKSIITHTNKLQAAKLQGMIIYSTCLSEWCTDCVVGGGGGGGKYKGKNLWGGLGKKGFGGGQEGGFLFGGRI